MFQSLVSFVQHQPLLAGGIGVTAGSYVIAHIKELPARLWSRFKATFSVTLTIYSEDAIYRPVNRWLSSHPSTLKMRRLAVARWYDRERDDDEFSLAPGPGFHILWKGKRPFFVDRHVDSDGKGENYGERRQTITITTLGRDQTHVRGFLDEVRRVQFQADTVPVYLYAGMGEFSLVERRAKRSLDTVYCAPGVKEDALADLTKFFDSRTDYQQRGIPYRRGYLLEGPPGTGKTTLIYALASALEKPVYLLNPSSLDNDNQLHVAVNAARDGLLVIEDIDSLRASENRETKDRPDAVGDASKAGVTLAGLLNALDGIGTREGNVLFLTSNTPEILDPALLRPGRVDRRFRLEKAGLGEARAMFGRLNPTGDVDNFVTTLDLPCAQAEIQNMILSSLQ